MSGGMRRVLTVWWDQWPVVAAGLLDRPAIVVRGGRVAACSPAAAAEGVAIGQRRRDAQRRCPGAVIVPADPLNEARLFERIVQAVGEFSPRLEVVEPGWLCLVARGPARYFGGEQALAARICEAIAKALRPPCDGDRRGHLDRGVPAIEVPPTGVAENEADVARITTGLGIGIADGRATSAIAARLAARGVPGDPAVVAAAVAGTATTTSAVAATAGGAAAATATRAAAATATTVVARRCVVVRPGMSAEFLAPLNIGWLHEIGELDDDTNGLFARLGVLTCGRLAELDGPDVEARFGPAVRRVHTLVGGRDERSVRDVEAQAEEMVQQTFDEPVVAVEPLTFVAKQLADALAARLDAGGVYCVRLLVRAETEHGERSERVWYRSAGLSSTAMVERVRWQLDGWVRSAAAGGAAGVARSGDQPTAGVVLLRLEPIEVRQAGGEQLRLWGGLTEADGRALRAVSRLVGVLGREAVTVPAWRGGRLPAERYAWVPATDLDLGAPRLAGERVTPASAARHGPWPGALPAPAPALVFADGANPEIEVRAADGAVVAVGGRGEVTAAPATLVIGGREHAITAWAGPWPLDQRWWNGSGPDACLGVDSEAVVDVVAGAGTSAGADVSLQARSMLGRRARRRRLARFQLLTADGVAHLVALEQHRWWLLATYA